MKNVIGKNANIGKGTFEIEEIVTPIKQKETNYYMSLSPTILQDEKIIDFISYWFSYIKLFYG